MRRYQIFFLILYSITILLSVVFSTILNLTQLSFSLLLFAFVLGFVVAIYGSLSIREEEEEKS